MRPMIPIPPPSGLKLAPVSGVTNVPSMVTAPPAGIRCHATFARLGSGVPLPTPLGGAGGRVRGVGVRPPPGGRGRGGAARARGGGGPEGARGGGGGGEPHREVI